MSLDDSFFDVIEEFEDGASDAFFPSSWRRVSCSDDRFCKHCGALLPSDWFHVDCPDCHFWCEKVSSTLAAENFEYQRYLASLVPDSVCVSDLSFDDDSYIQDDLFKDKR